MFHVCCCWSVAVFTKQEADRACKDTPITVLDSKLGGVMTNGKVQLSRPVPPILKTPRSQEKRKTKTVTFQGDSVAGSSSTNPA